MPVWQNGTPQSMQRAACSRERRLGASGGCASLQSRIRSSGGAASRRRLALELDEAGAACPSSRAPDPGEVRGVLLERGHLRLVRRSGPRRASGPAPRARAGSRAGSPGRTRATVAGPSRRGARPPARCRSASTWRSTSSRSRGDLARRGVGERLEARPSRCCSASANVAVSSRTQAIPPDMPAAKLRPVAPEDHDAAAGHVLAAVVADPLHDRGRAGVADREPLARDVPRMNASPAVAP